MRRRVVITGMGAITPLGNCVEALYRNQLEGKSGVGPITLFNASRFPTKIAGQVKDFNLDRPNYTCLTACAASSQAIGEATELIRHGDADIMLSGGAHSMIHPLGVTGFNRLTALSTSNDAPAKASRPFDARRDGFVLGEGAGRLVLEE